MQFEFRVLGPLEARRDGETLTLSGTKLRVLLADLLVRPGQVVTIDRLVEDLWPRGAPGDPPHAIQQHVSLLRKTLGDPGRSLVRERPPGYVLDVDPGSVDAVRFERLLSQARDAAPSDPARAAASAAEAVALWRGDAFADVAYESFAQAEIARLEELRLEAEEVRIDAELALGKASELVGEVEALVANAPMRERRHKQLMLALYRAGQQAEAAEAFQSARRRLLEYGLEPSEELRELQRRILRQDPTLLGHAPVHTTRRLSRRLVTVVAVEPDVSLDLDPEDHEREIRRAADTVGRVAREYGAQEPERFVLVFPHEDQWQRAARAATELRESLGALVGQVTDEALVGDGIVGGPLIARARAHAREGIVEVPARVAEPSVEPPFVGRERELEQLRVAHATLVVGPPGIGKSRLARELGRAQLAALGRCSSYAGRPLEPLYEVAAALGQEGALADTPAGDIPFAFRALCASVAEPLLVVVDDVQWADPLVLEALEQLIAHPSEQLRVLCLAREELLDERPSILPGADRLTLAPLNEEESETLASRLASESVDVRRALHAAEGNPLFIEQLLAHSAEGGETLPATLQALLAARLDLLGPTERDVVQHAAVVGREFDASLVGELLTAATHTSLASLVRRGFLDVATSATPFEERFRFRHALIHEAAYATVPRAERSTLHERLADLIATIADDETVAFHLERAVALRAERDRHTARLAEDASRRLAAAAAASWRFGHITHTASLFRRALALVDADDTRRPALLCELGVALNTAGGPSEALAAFREAAQLAERLDDVRIALRAEIETRAVSLLQQLDTDPAELVRVADRAIPVFESLHDHRSLGRALMLSGWVLGGWAVQNEAWRERAAKALEHYRASGFPTSACVAQIAAATYYGPLPAPKAAEVCSKLLDREVDDRAGHASVSACLGGALGMLGRFDDAREHLTSARQAYTDLGREPARVFTCGPIEADVAWLMGDDEAALALQLDVCTTLRDLEYWSPLRTQAARLIEHLCRLDYPDEARAWFDVASAHPDESDLHGLIALTSAEARLLSYEAPDAAVVTARRAVELAAPTDGVGYQAGALLVLADCELAVGDDAASERAREDARALYEQKENVAAVVRLQETAATS